MSKIKNIIIAILLAVSLLFSFNYFSSKNENKIDFSFFEEK